MCRWGIWKHDGNQALCKRYFQAQGAGLRAKGQRSDDRGQMTEIRDRDQRAEGKGNKPSYLRLHVFRFPIYDLRISISQFLFTISRFPFSDIRFTVSELRFSISQLLIPNFQLPFCEFRYTFFDIRFSISQFLFTISRFPFSDIRFTVSELRFSISQLLITNFQLPISA
jgi:hypothetical protein